MTQVTNELLQFIYHFNFLGLDHSSLSSLLLHHEAVEQIYEAMARLSPQLCLCRNDVVRVQPDFGRGEKRNTL